MGKPSVLRLILSIGFILVVFSGPIAGTAKKDLPYRCPLDRHNGFSSSFQDFRATHFHGGIDFRTFQRTGFPVHAVCRGEVVRLRMVRRGSGRGIYILHPDGNTSIYFHLDRFAPELERILKQRQQQKGVRYVGDIDLQPPVPVKEGELIGYSGETGYGFPHLHLEIRDAEGTRLNPFDLVRTGVHDANPPLFRELLLRTGTHGRVNGRVGEIRVPLERGPGGFIARIPLVITGEFQAVVGLKDISDTGRPVTPRKVEARLDGRRVFALEFTRFTWADNNQLGFVYDMEESSPGRFFFNLFTQPGYTLEQTGVGLPSAWAGAAPGTRRLQIDAVDQSGNPAAAVIGLEKRPPPVVRVVPLSRKSDGLAMEVQECHAPGADRLECVLLDSRGKPVGESGRDLPAPFPVTLHMHSSGPAVAAEFRLLSRGTVYAYRRFSTDWAAPLPRKIVLDPWVTGDAVQLRLPGVQLGEDALRLRLGNKGAPWQSPEACRDGLVFNLEGRAVAAAAPAPEHLLALQFALLNKNRIVELRQETLRLLRLEPGREARFRWGPFQARFASRSVRAPRLMTATRRSLPGEFPCLSPQVHLGPENFAFLDAVDYSFTRDVKNPRQVAIFSWDSRGKRWRAVSTRLDMRAHRYSTRVRSSATFALFRDTAAPHITFRSSLAPEPPVITITDRGTGVDDLSVTVRLDGRRVEVEYDPDRRRVRFLEAPQFSRGVHFLKVTCRDRAGNTAGRSWKWRTGPVPKKNG